jgi:hypothetical protein
MGLELDTASRPEIRLDDLVALESEAKRVPCLEYITFMAQQIPIQVHCARVYYCLMCFEPCNNSDESFKLPVQALAQFHTRRDFMSTF